MNIFDVWLIACLSFLVGGILSFVIFRRSKKSDVEMGEHLMSAINNARQDVLRAHEMINEMEGVNLVLRTENHQLRVENLDLKSSADQMREQLNDALDNIFYLQQEVAKYFPKSQKPEKKDSKQ
jgi:hypothetical protein